MTLFHFIKRLLLGLSMIRYIKNKLPYLWKVIEIINSISISLLYKKELVRIMNNICSYQISDKIFIKLAKTDNVIRINELLSQADANDVKYFRPFEFSEKKILCLVKNNANQFYFLSDRTNLIGIFFLRFFGNKQAYLGFYIVKEKRGHGIGTQILKILIQSFQNSNILLSATVSKNNVASLKSHLKAGFIIKKELANDFVLLQLPH